MNNLTDMRDLVFAVVETTVYLRVHSQFDADPGYVQLLDVVLESVNLVSSQHTAIDALKRCVVEEKVVVILRACAAAKADGQKTRSCDPFCRLPNERALQTFQFTHVIAKLEKKNFEVGLCGPRSRAAWKRKTFELLIIETISCPCLFSAFKLFRTPCFVHKRSARTGAYFTVRMTALHVSDGLALQMTNLQGYLG